MIENKRLFEDIKKKLQEYHYDDGEATAYFTTYVYLRDIKEGEVWEKEDFERAADSVYYAAGWIDDKPKEDTSRPFIPSYVLSVLVDVFQLRWEDHESWTADEADLGEEFKFDIIKNKLVFCFDWSGKIRFSGNYYPAVITADPYYSSPAEGDDESDEAACYLAKEFESYWQKELDKHLNAKVAVDIDNIEY